MLNELGFTDAMTDQASAQAATAGQGPGGRLGKEEFLRLLVTQLGNQDPLNPMDGQQFAAQLAQFTSVEQLVNISEVLAQNGEMNGMLAQSINSGVAAGLIGKSVQAPGNTVAWNGEGRTAMQFELASTAANVTITVRDASGTAVREFELGGHAAGKHSFDWDGTTRAGATAATGSYTFDVTAADSAGNAVQTATFTEGVVDRITFGRDGIRLWLGEYAVAMSDISSVE